MMRRDGPKFKKMYRKQKQECYLCGRHMVLELGKENTATIDHVIPVSITRTMMLGCPERNKRLACYSCNQRKKSKRLFECEWRITK